MRLPFVLTRGGSISDSDDDEVDLDEEGEEEDDDDEEEIEDEVAELDPVMVKAAKKASHKSKEKLTAAIEAAEKDKGMDENPPILKALKKATSAKECTGKAIESAIQEIFHQYSNLLPPVQTKPAGFYPFA